jgi:uncharacterized membrane protein
MDLTLDLNTLEIIARFYLPLVILSLLFFGYVLRKNQFKQFSIDRIILLLIIVGGFIGSVFNIPIYVSKDLLISINVGAIIIPLIVSGIFIMKFSGRTMLIIILTLFVALSTYLLAYVEPGFGILIGFPYYFIPIVIGIVIAFFLLSDKYPREVIPVAYSSVSLGVLIGTDILLLPRALDDSIRVGYIGGLGIFDYIYISGLYAMGFLLFLLIIKYRFDNRIKEKLIT